MSKVALIKGEDRKDNILQALELIADEIQMNGRHPVIKVNFVSAHVPLCATHRDAVQAVVEFLKNNGAKDITLAEGATFGSLNRALREYGYQDMIKHFGLRVVDLNDPDEWKRVFVIHPDLKPHPVKLADTMVDPENYIISVTRPKSHMQVGVTLTAKNVIMGSIMLMDKIRMHPSEAGNRLLDFNLFNVMQHLHIDLGVLDGFEGMQGSGPINGEPISHKIAIAGSDYLSVDRVGTEVMGADFDDIRYLNYLWDQGFGEADLSKIDVVGSSIEECRIPYDMSVRFLRMRRQEEKGQHPDIAVYAG